MQGLITAGDIGRSTLEQKAMERKRLAEAAQAKRQQIIAIDEERLRGQRIASAPTASIDLKEDQRVHIEEEAQRGRQSFFFLHEFRMDEGFDAHLIPP